MVRVLDQAYLVTPSLPDEMLNFVSSSFFQVICIHTIRLLCCILIFDPAKHAIPKTEEVTYSVGQLWEEIVLAGLADNMGQG